MSIPIRIQSGLRGARVYIYLAQPLPLHMYGTRAKRSSTEPKNLSVQLLMQRNNDIRSWMSPQRTTPPQQATPSPLQQRRRRIIESDSSDDNIPEPLQPNDAGHMQDPPILPPPPAAPFPALHAPVIEVIDDSESDDMYIPLPQHTRQQNALPERQAQPGRQRPSPHPVPVSRRRASARAAPPANNVRNQRRRIAGEAEETDQEDDDSSECIESDTNAQQLYREAILGVRNARNSRLHMRSHTTPCSVCAIFGQFLQHFVQR